MHVDADRLRLSPSDLSAFLGCRHRTGLDLAVVARRARQADAGRCARRGVAQARGRARAGLCREPSSTGPTRRHDRRQRRLGGPGCGHARYHAERGRGHRAGRASGPTVDGLCRHPAPRRDARAISGAWSYEPYDTKLARETRGGTILQLATYVDLLERMQGLRPERFHVVTPAPLNAASVCTG